jgi:acyl carrier protein
MNDNDLAGLLDATRQALVAFQQNQERTAAVHAEFLNAHAKSTESFTAMFAAHARLVELAAGTRPADAASGVSLRAVAAPAPVSGAGAMLGASVGEATAALADAIIRPPSASSPERLALPSTARPAVAAADDLPPLLTATRLAELVKGGPPSRAPEPQPIAPEAPPDVGDLLLATVAEKTGYPQDLLDMEMNLEADLGIDSIKRVEILSAIQDALPGLPTLEDDEVAGLRTLADVRDFLVGALEGTAGAARVVA